MENISQGSVTPEDKWPPKVEAQFKSLKDRLQWIQGHFGTTDISREISRFIDELNVLRRMQTRDIGVDERSVNEENSLVSKDES